MDSLAPVTTMTLATSVVLLVVNVDLYRKYGRSYLARWAVAWGLYALRFCFDLMRYVVDWPYWAVLVHIAAVASGLLLFLGAVDFLPGKRNGVRAWVAAAVVAGIWPVVAASISVGFLAMSLPPFIFLGCANLFIAWRFFQSSRLDAAGRWVTIVAFTLWGLHKLDYPLLRPIPGAAAWGYMAGSMLAICAGVGLLIIFLAAEQSRAKENESRFESLVESLEDIVFTLDAEGRHTVVFGAWVDRVGRKPAHYIGRSAVDLFGPDSGTIHVESAQTVFRRNESVTYEWGMPGDDGSRHFQTTLSPIRDAAGRCVEIVGVAREVTALKRAVAEVENRLREKEVLLREVHHRVKNNLQVIGSLLSLQSREIESEEAARAFSSSIDRIYALGDIHNLVYAAPDVARIEIGAIVAAVVDRVSHSHPGSRPPELRLEIGARSADLDLAVPLSIVVTELVSAAAEDTAQYSVVVRDTADALSIEVGRISESRQHILPDAAAPPLDDLRSRLVDALCAQLGAGLERSKHLPATRLVVPLP